MSLCILHWSTSSKMSDHPVQQMSQLAPLLNSHLKHDFGLKFVKDKLHVCISYNKCLGLLSNASVDRCAWLSPVHIAGTSCCAFSSMGNAFFMPFEWTIREAYCLGPVCWFTGLSASCDLAYMQVSVHIWCAYSLHQSLSVDNSIGHFDPVTLDGHAGSWTLVFHKHILLRYIFKILSKKK